MIGNVLKKSREALNIPQSKVAELVGVTKQTYLKWENDVTEPKASQISNLAKVLSITENEICRGELLSGDMDELAFMKTVSSIKYLIDEISFISIVYQCVDNKKKLLTLLEQEVEKTHGYNKEEYEALTYEERATATIKTTLTDYDNQVTPSPHEKY